jgi:MFS transporter, putative metabolite transport protein
MSNIPNTLSGQSQPRHQPRTVQDYIDERPIWPDGTHVPSIPMTKMQRLIWMLAAAGKFFEGFVVFMTGVALPLIARQFEIGPAQNGLVTAASLCGILIGAVGQGSLSDHFGRKSMFVVEMIIFTAFLTATVFATSFFTLVFCLFGLGLALGCDYPTAHMIISENIPSTSRGRLVLGGIRFSGRWSPWGRCSRLCSAACRAKSQCVALDVCHGGCAGPSRHYRPLLHH